MKPIDKLRTMDPIRVEHPLKTAMQLATPDESSIPEGSIGARRMVWMDRGQVKLSARVASRFGPAFALILITGFFAATYWAVFGPSAAAITLSLLAASVIGILVLLSVYNAVVRAATGVKRTPSVGVGRPVGDRALPGEHAEPACPDAAAACEPPPVGAAATGTGVGRDDGA